MNTNPNCEWEGSSQTIRCRYLERSVKYISRFQMCVRIQNLPVKRNIGDTKHLLNKQTLKSKQRF